MKLVFAIVAISLTTLPSSQALAQTNIEQRLDTKPYYAEKIKEAEAKNTELIADSFIKYFWRKPIAKNLPNTQISIVKRVAYLGDGSTGKLRAKRRTSVQFWKKREQLFTKNCSLSASFYVGGSRKPTSKQLIFYDNAPTRNLNGKMANNYTFSLGEYSKDAAGKYIRDANGACLPIPAEGSGALASDRDSYVPSRNALAIHYALKQKGVDLGHCAIRQKINQIANLNRLVVVDCYLENHGFNKKQASILQNVYPTISIATYGNKFLGISIYDATYTDADVGKTWAEIYAGRRSNEEFQKKHADYLAKYIQRTRAKKDKLNDEYFQHLGHLNSAPHFHSRRQSDISNLTVADKYLETKPFPVVQLSKARKNALITDYKFLHERIYSAEWKAFDVFVNHYTPYSKTFRRPMIGVGPNEAQMLAASYRRALTFQKNRKYGAFWQKKVRKENMAAKVRFYSVLALSLGSQRALEERAKLNIPNINKSAKTSLAYQVYVAYQTEAVRLSKLKNPNDVLAGKVLFSDNSIETKTKSAQKNLHLLMSRALVNQADVLEGPNSPHYTRSLIDRKRDALIAPAYPRAAYRCDKIFRGLADANFRENVLRPFLVQCIRAAPNKQILVKHFNQYIKNKYFSLEKVVKYSDQVDVIAIAEKKFVAFGDTKSAAVMRDWMKRNELEIARSGDRWRSEAEVEFAARRVKRQKNRAARMARANEERRKAAQEKADKAAYHRRVREKLARLDAQTRGRQSTGQMISNAMGNIIKSRPTINQMANDANRRIAASQRQAAAKRRAEQQRRAAASQVQRNQSAERARQQRAAQQRASDRRIAENKAARQKAADQRAVQQRASQQRAQAQSRRVPYVGKSSSAVSNNRSSSPMAASNSGTCTGSDSKCVPNQYVLCQSGPYAKPHRLSCGAASTVYLNGRWRRDGSTNDVMTRTCRRALNDPNATSLTAGSFSRNSAFVSRKSSEYLGSNPRQLCVQKCRAEGARRNQGTCITPN